MALLSPGGLLGFLSAGISWAADMSLPLLASDAVCTLGLLGEELCPSTCRYLRHDCSMQAAGLSSQKVGSRALQQGAHLLM